MRFIPAKDGQLMHRLELTRRNLEILLAKLDDPHSQRQIVDPDWHIIVGAVEGKECVEVVPVENNAHYSDRQPGAMFMPGTGEIL